MKISKNVIFKKLNIKKSDHINKKTYFNPKKIKKKHWYMEKIQKLKSNDQNPERIKRIYI